MMLAPPRTAAAHSMNVTARSGALNGSSSGSGPGGAGIFGAVTLCLGRPATSMNTIETMIPAAARRASRLAPSTVSPFRELPIEPTVSPVADISPCGTHRATLKSRPVTSTISGHGSR
jgi:hypothetical protein